MASTFPPDPDEIDAPDEASALEATVDPFDIGTTVPWDGSSPATAALAALLGTVAPQGTLRLVIQRLALHEHGERRGTHHVADAITDVGDARLWSETTLIDLRVAEVANPRPGDRIEIDGEAFLIQGEPIRDRERLVWTVDLRPA